MPGTASPSPSAGARTTRRAGDGKSEGGGPVVGRVQDRWRRCPGTAPPPRRPPCPGGTPRHNVARQCRRRDPWPDPWACPGARSVAGHPAWSAPVRRGTG